MKNVKQLNDSILAVLRVNYGEMFRLQPTLLNFPPPIPPAARPPFPLRSAWPEQLDAQGFVRWRGCFRAGQEGGRERFRWWLGGAA